METLSDIFKGLGAVVVLNLIIWPQLKKMFYRQIFERNRRHYEARFNILNSEEQVELLKASQLPNITYSTNRIADASKDEKNPMLSGILIDVEYDRLTDLFTKLPSYQDLNETKRSIEFFKYLMTQWKAMTFASDYNFEEFKAELEHVFANRSSLAVQFDKVKFVHAPRETQSKISK